MSDLEDILNGTESSEEVTEETTAETSETPTEEAPKGEEPKAETEEKVETKEEPKEDSTPESKKSEDAAWQYEAYKDEKRKRQELERKLEEIQNPKEPVKAPDVFEDQEGFSNHIADMVSQSELKVKAEMSKFMADREFGADVVTQKLATFKEMVANDPNLSNRVLTAVSPVH